MSFWTLLVGLAAYHTSSWLGKNSLSTLRLRTLQCRKSLRGRKQKYFWSIQSALCRGNTKKSKRLKIVLNLTYAYTEDMLRPQWFLYVTNFNPLFEEKNQSLQVMYHQVFNLSKHTQDLLFQNLGSHKKI
jgi:hypothetical protein